jgi:hypothetical protein
LFILGSASSGDSHDWWKTYHPWECWFHSPGPDRYVILYYNFIIIIDYDSLELSVHYINGKPIVFGNAGTIPQGQIGM